VTPGDSAENEGSNREADPVSGEDAKEPRPKVARYIVVTGRSRDQKSADAKEPVDGDQTKRGLSEDPVISETTERDRMRNDNHESQHQAEKIEAVALS
jgi:hypothetical protein